MSVKKSLNNIKAVFFDMDGVIVDSMPYHFISWFETLKKYGITVSPFDIYEKEGEKCEICVKRFFEREGMPCSAETVDDVLKIRNRLYKKYFKLYLFSGIENLLKELKKRNLSLAIVTGSAKEKVMSMLPAKILKFFDVVISGDMLKRGKPFPDPYLTAAKQLKLKPSQCMVVENAPYGIRSAKSAKMFCVAVTTSLPGRYLDKADKVICGIKDILKLF